MGVRLAWEGRWSVKGGACDRGERGGTTPFKGVRGTRGSAMSPSGVALVDHAVIVSGGLCAGAGQSPRWLRISSRTSGCAMKAMIPMEPPHSENSKGVALGNLLDEADPPVPEGLRDCVSWAPGRFCQPSP